jgi:hypothetical protein
MQEKGWLGYKEQVIHSGEGPIWAIEWRGDLIAWANDLVSCVAPMQYAAPTDTTGG